MEDTLIKYNTAVLAKEKGFGENCNAWYFIDSELIIEKCSHDQFGIGGFLAPTQSLLAKWLREKHGIHVEVTFDAWNNEKYEVSICQKGNKDLDFDVMGNFDTFEQAYEKGLQEALKLIK